MNPSKKWYVMAIIIILIVAVIGGYIYFTGTENNRKSSYTEHYFKLEMESDNQTKIYWPIPYDSYNEGDKSYGNLSDLVYDLKVVEGNGSIAVEETENGKALGITFKESVILKGSKRIYWDKEQNFNETKKYIFDDLTMRNTTDLDGENFFVYSSTDLTHIDNFKCYRENVGEYDSNRMIGLYIEDLKLMKGWQSVEFSGGAPKYEEPEDETSSNTYTMTFEGGGVFEYKLKFKSIFDYFADPDPTDSSTDSDDDGLTDAEEYDMSNKSDSYSVNGRAVPTRKDIFVEVDWMDGHEMSDGAKWRVGTRFLNNPTGEEIWLHLDAPIAGSPNTLMGGGEEIPYDEETSTQEFKDIYDQNFSDNRVGLFHYGVFGNVDNNDVDGYTWMRSDKFWISDANMDPRVKDQAQTFMHELGHSFGLDADNYWESKSTDIFGSPDDPIDDSVYPSVMRYGTMSVIDYSGEDGTVEVWEWFDSDNDGEEDSWREVQLNTNDWELVINNVGVAL